MKKQLKEIKKHLKHFFPDYWEEVFNRILLYRMYVYSNGFRLNSSGDMMPSTDEELVERALESVHSRTKAAYDLDKSKDRMHSTLDLRGHILGLVSWGDSTEGRDFWKSIKLGQGINLRYLNSEKK